MPLPLICTRHEREPDHELRSILHILITRGNPRVRHGTAPH